MFVCEVGTSYWFFGLVLNVYSGEPSQYITQYLWL